MSAMTPARGWWKALGVYTERRLIIILLLGFSSGLPLALTGSTLALWMRDEGVNLSTIGLFALVGLPYSIKFLWAPFIDHVRLPVLTTLLGRRRAWLVVTQLALALAVSCMGLVDPRAAPLLMAAAAVAVAFISATQDIVIDAFRIESLAEDEQAAAMANFVAAYRIAMLVATGGTVGLVAWLQATGVNADLAWTYGYVAMASLVGVGFVATLLAEEPEASASETPEPENVAQRFRHAVIDPFFEFTRRRQWVAILVFIILFKLGDAYAGHLLGPFAIDLGFEKGAYAGISSSVGLVAALAGGYFGGWLVNAVGQTRGLWIGGVLQMISNLVFCWLAFMGPDLFALAVAVAIESFTGGIGTVAFVGWISSLCRIRSFTATQYALLSALSSFGRTFLSASGGEVAQNIGWVPFFVVSTLLAVPGLVLLWWLGRSNAIEPREQT
ncbi:MAG: MFS transporter [Parvibaculum sp.]|uniref:AmpG family muropeptide MFS transporter n=1 Tax=Parvibaculum sp. TaxID=2024848 RepID=UPI00271A2C0A|nr:MFS transporter [Parvibaculum sp.]MDO8837511.1 MFS transporter [Parvibaculum sp.]